MSKIDEHEAAETLRLLQEMGSYEPELDDFKSSLEEEEV
jgi:hydrogenase maturation factor